MIDKLDDKTIEKLRALKLEKLSSNELITKDEHSGDSKE